jgi:hypothetical protein
MAQSTSAMVNHGELPIMEHDTQQKDIEARSPALRERAVRLAEPDAVNRSTSSFC